MLNRFIKDESGQFAVISAVLAVPLMVCVGIAVDSSILNKDKGHLQAALDSAALAAVTPANLTVNERTDFAAEVFKNNYQGHENVLLKIKASNSRVDIEGTLDRRTLLMGLTGQDRLTVRNHAAAVKTTEDVICVMTLNDTQEGSLTIEKDAELFAPNCSIQVNSSHERALMSTGTYAPSTKKICVNGSVTGNLGPDVQANCSKRSDPYKNMEAHVPASNNECDFGPISIFKVSSYREVIDAGEKNSVRKPGVYCNGLHLHGSNVTLEPGVYTMHNGPLTIGDGANVKGEGVTFVFTGNTSTLYTNGNFNLDLTAPKSGKYAGLLFFQDKNSSPDEIAIIKGGANIKLNGTTYFPTQDLFIGGTGEMGTLSPSMAFIAENVTFTSDIDAIISQGEARLRQFIDALEFVVKLAGGRTNVNPNYASRSGANKVKKFTTNILTSASSHEDSGMPPILPRTDGSARLVTGNVLIDAGLEDITTSSPDVEVQDTSAPNGPTDKDIEDAIIDMRDAQTRDIAARVRL